MKTPDQTLIAALNVLARDIQSEDGVANACIAEGAQRIQELSERVAELTQALEFVAEHLAILRPPENGVILASVSLAISLENANRTIRADATPFDLILKAAKAHVRKEPTK